LVGPTIYDSPRYVNIYVKFWGHPSAILVLLLNGFLEEFEAPSKVKHGQNFQVHVIKWNLSSPNSWALSLHESDEPLPSLLFFGLAYQGKDIVFRFIIEYIVA
jgi:hypothetical protein